MFCLNCADHFFLQSRPLTQVLGLFIVRGQSPPAQLEHVLDEEDWALAKAETQDPLVSCCAFCTVIDESCRVKASAIERATDDSMVSKDLNPPPYLWRHWPRDRGHVVGWKVLQGPGNWQHE
eukprot:991957-Pelagomonas_calceolata.AAC.2